MKNRIRKKQIRRLWEATAHYRWDRDYTEYCPAKKPISGKSARRLISEHYRELDEYEGGWSVYGRPRFRPERMYIILAEQGEQDRYESLRIVRAEDARHWPAGVFERNLDPC